MLTKCLNTVFYLSIPQNVIKLQAKIFHNPRIQNSDHSISATQPCECGGGSGGSGGGGGGGAPHLLQTARSLGTNPSALQYVIYAVCVYAVRVHVKYNRKCPK